MTDNGHMTSTPATPDSPDSALPTPPAWLDDVTGERALAWARERNAEAEERLGTARFERLEHDIREVLDSPGRIPMVSVRGDDAFNFWTDADHPRGLWRRQPLDAYLAGGDDWDVLIDVDALAAADGVSWVWHGASVLYPANDRALIDLSDGGSDTDITREFDLASRAWVAPEDCGFTRPPSKGGLTWIDRDHVWAALDLGPDTVSTAGYPLQARVLTRGQALENAPVVLTGAPVDMSVDAGHDTTPGFERSFVTVAHDFYHFDTFLLRDPVAPDAAARLEHLDVPADAEVSAWREWLLVFLHSDWEVEGVVHPTGALLAFDLAGFLAGDRGAHTLFAPDGRAFLQGFTATRHHVVLTVMVDVVSEVRVATPPRHAGAPSSIPIHEGDAPLPGPGRSGESVWGHSAPDLAVADIPPLSTISVGAVAPREDDRVWMTASGFTTPTTLSLLDLDPVTGAVVSSRVARRAPNLFDTKGVEVSQHFARSADGTRVPYFQVGAPGGNPGAPTLLYGYGGFENAMLPGYSAGVGRALLERGGTYVVANIRGGGEYGPAWHQAALTRNRPRAYEDFEAVARDLIARGVTTPSRLGIQGGSNGGLLTGNMLMRVPDLFGAVVIQAPLLDMRRYHTLLAGASWMAEYGDPDDPEQWDFIRAFSPFHLFDPARAYPPVLLTTSTRDDRVHPAHARTLAWRMREAGCDVSFFENIEGGHSGAADNAQRAHMQALVWEFLWQQLGD